MQQPTPQGGPELLPATPGSPAPPDRQQRIENRALFIRCMADPVRRRIAFSVVERNCRDLFGEGEEGLDLFLQLVADVRRAGINEAVKEFENRFAPMLDQSIAQRKLHQPR
jgi:hypothetical protein